MTAPDCSCDLCCRLTLQLIAAGNAMLDLKRSSRRKRGSLAVARRRYSWARKALQQFQAGISCGCVNRVKRHYGAV
jgi:hypothetical protein